MEGSFGCLLFCAFSRAAGTRLKREAAWSRRKLAHHVIQRRLPFETDAGAVGEQDVAVPDLRIVGKAREHAEHARIAFRAAESEAGRDRKRHLVAAMGEVARA